MQSYFIQFNWIQMTFFSEIKLFVQQKTDIEIESNIDRLG